MSQSTFHSTCYDPEWVAKQLGDNAPKIQYYLCDVTAPEGQRLRPWGRSFNRDEAAMPQV